MRDALRQIIRMFVYPDTFDDDLMMAQRLEAHKEIVAAHRAYLKHISTGGKDYSAGFYDFFLQWKGTAEK